MAKKISSIILLIALVLTLTTTAFASPDVTEAENVVYLANTASNEVSLLGSEVFYNTYTVAAGGSLSVYSSESSNGYFTSTPGTSCVLNFTASTTSISVVRITIGGVVYTLPTSYTSAGSGMYRYYVNWVSTTATPYMIQITNNSGSSITITAMSISY